MRCDVNLFARHAGTLYKMSDLESLSSLSESSDSTAGSFSSNLEEDDVLVIPGQYEPYQYEPLARPGRQKANKDSKMLTKMA